MAQLERRESQLKRMGEMLRRQTVSVEASSLFILQVINKLQNQARARLIGISGLRYLAC